MDEQTCSDYIYVFDSKAAACNECIENNFLFPLFFLISFIPFTIAIFKLGSSKIVFICPYVRSGK